jgi:hypothetical protein
VRCNKTRWDENFRGWAVPNAGHQPLKGEWEHEPKAQISENAVDAKSGRAEQ